MSRVFLIVGGVLAGASGAVALGHELLWTRRLVDLLGGSSESNTRVLSLFFLGLSLGAAFSQRLLSRAGNTMLWLGLAELIVGLTTIPVIYLSELTNHLWAALGSERLTSFEGIFLKFVVSVLVVLPPSVAMGTTLPLLFASLFRREGTLGRHGIGVYAINTAGGLLGLMAVVAFALPAFGARGSMVMLSAANMLLGLICVGLSTRSEFRSRVNDSPPVRFNSSVEFEPSRLPMLIAFLSGFGLLASEITILQTIMLVVPLSYHGPAAVLGTVVALLAVSAPLASKLSKNKDSAVKDWLPVLLWAAGLAAVLSPFWFLMVASAVPLGTAANVGFFTVKVGVLVLCTFGALFFCQGFLFPMSMILFEKERGESVQRGDWSSLLVANGVGGLLGAEFAYRGLLPAFGVHVSLGLIGLLYLSVASWLSRYWFPKSGWRVVTLTFGIVVTAFWSTRLPQMNPNLPFTILRQSVGADGLVAVIEGEGPGRAIVVSNQYILGSSSGQYDQARQAHIPLLLHQAPRNVGFIGLATGMTPGGAVQHSAVEAINVAEISKGVVRAAKDYFSNFNNGLFEDSRTRIFSEDGRILIMANPRQFDVLVGDLFLPWGTGASRLYSIEHFHSARESLRDGGLFCQWLPMYQLTEEQFDRILATFQKVFPSTYLFRNNSSPLNPSIGMVGFREGSLSWEVVQKRCYQELNSGRIVDPGMLHWETIAMHYLGLANQDKTGAHPITLDNIWLEIDASRQQITGVPEEKYLAGNRWARFLTDRLPIIAKVDAGEKAFPWHQQGFAILQWEWEHFKSKFSKSHNQESVENSKKAILEQIPKPIEDAILARPQAWSSNVELFQ